VSATTLSAPDEARKRGDKAQPMKADRNPGAAAASSGEGGSKHTIPQFAEAWYQLGKTREADKPQDA